MSAILAAYFAAAALRLNNTGTTPADIAASHVLGVIGGGLLLLTVLIACEAYLKSLATEAPSDNEVDHQG
jgi:hypothetical protein